MNVIPHVRDMTMASHQKNYECFSAVWSLLSLLIATVIIIGSLSCMMTLNKRKRRYPERGVVLQRNIN